MGPQAGSMSGWSAAISYDLINQNRMQIGTRGLDFNAAQGLLNPPVSTGNEVELQTATRTTTLDVDYNTETWGLSLQVPYVDKYHTTLPDGTDQSYAVSQYGTLGDVKLLGKYAGWSRDGDSGAILGVQLPTGRTDTRFQSGDPLDASLQPGTGASQLIVGAFTSGQQGKLGWFAQGTWQNAVSHKDGYTPGATTIVNAGLRWAELGQQLVPLLQLNLVHRASDRGVDASYQFDGTPMTGGRLAYLAPGVAATLPAGFSAYGYLQLPIYTDVNGVQLVPRYILSLGLRKLF